MLHQLRDVFASFQKHDVKYMIIGGIAAILYGVPRATFDLDILIEADNLHNIVDTKLARHRGLFSDDEFA